MVRIILVDDHQLFREGLRALLQAEPDLVITHTANDAREARRVVGEQPCDVVVVDISLPDTSGTALVRTLRREVPGARILMLSMHRHADVVADAFAAGASGYALKSQSPHELFDAIRAVAAGERYISPSLAAQVPSATAPRPVAGLLGALSVREREVFDLLVRGESNQSISQLLFISIKTVETHRMRIMKKLDVHSIGDLIRLAARHGHLAA
jgi:DNA-binding NarL/FixJ family response regulator